MLGVHVPLWGFSEQESMPQWQPGHGQPQQHCGQSPATVIKARALTTVAKLPVVATSSLLRASGQAPPAAPWPELGLWLRWQVSCSGTQDPNSCCLRKPYYHGQLQDKSPWAEWASSVDWIWPMSQMFDAPNLEVGTEYKFSKFPDQTNLGGISRHFRGQT